VTQEAAEYFKTVTGGILCWRGKGGGKGKTFVGVGADVETGDLVWGRSAKGR